MSAPTFQIEITDESTRDVFLIGPSVMDIVPGLSEALGQVIMQWSAVEFQMSCLLTEIIGRDHGLTIALFEKFKKSAGVFETIKSAANHAFNGEKLSQINDIFSRYQFNLEKRNAFSHSMWGVNKSNIDKIFCIKPKDLVNFSYHIRIGLDSEKFIENLSEYISSLSDIYTINSILDVADNSKKLATDLTVFIFTNFKQN